MKNLIKVLVNNKSIQSDVVYNVMSNVDRSEFVKTDPFDDCPQYLGYGATISAPHMHAYALEYLKDYLKQGSKVLDVGSGSGYLCAAFSTLMNHNGLVIGIEHIPELYDLSINNLNKSYSKQINNKTIKIYSSDGRVGFKDNGPYNCIHVGAAAEDIPKDLIDQLAFNGRMMIPVGKNNNEQYIVIVDKDNVGNIKTNKVMNVRYVPLTSKETQLNSCQY